MKKAALALSLTLPLLLFGFHPAFAHFEVVEGDIRFVAGWGTEPPLINQLNTIVIQVTRVSDDRSITNAFASAEVVVKKGGVEREINMRPSEVAGWYEVDIIPTQLGQYAIEINGTIDRQPVSTEIEIEDVEDSRRLNFPDSDGAPGQGIPEDFIEQMRGVLTHLTLQIEDASDAAQDARDAASSAAESADETRAAVDAVYLIGIVGIGAGVAGIAIAAVALSRKA